jgi:hypothetical protein
MSYRIEGITSDGESFDLGPRYFDSHDEAVTYAMEYARSVTGTSRVEVERLWDRTVVTAQGEEYGERLTIMLPQLPPETADDRRAYRRAASPSRNR